MPKVPTYDQPTEQQQELPGVRQDTPRHILNLAELGPGENVRLGNQMQSSGAQLAQIATEQQFTERQASANDALTQLAQAHTGIMHDPDSGYMNASGKNAVDGKQATVDTLQKMQQALEDQLPDDATKTMFRRAAQQRTDAAILAVNEHASQQTKQYALDSSMASASINKDAAVASYNPMPGADNSVYVQSIQKQEAELNKQADMMGLTLPDPSSPDYANAKAARDQYIKYGHDGKSGTVATMANVVTHLVENNQTAAAQDYFSRVQGNLPPAVADNLRDALKHSASVDDMYKYTDTLFQQLPGDEAGQRKQVAADFAAGKIDGGQRKIIESRISQNAADQRSQQSDQAANVLGNVADFVAKNQGTSILDFAKKYPMQYQILQKSGHLETAIKYFDGGNKEGDPALYNTLLDMAVDNKKALLDYPVDKIYASLSPAQANHVMEARRGINKQDTQQMESDKLVTTTMRNVSKYISDAGVNLSPKSDKDKANLDAFMANLRMTLYSRVRDNNGVPISQKEADDIALSTLKDHAISGTGYFGTHIGQTHKPLYQMTPEERAANWEVPDADRQAITQKLQAAGMQATEQNIQQYYKLSRQ